MLLALGFGLVGAGVEVGVGGVSGCFLVCDVGREIKGDRVLAALWVLRVCSVLSCGNWHVPVYRSVAVSPRLAALFLLFQRM